MIQLYITLNAEKITGMESKVYIPPLFKDIGIKENHILLPTSVLHHIPNT